MRSSRDMSDVSLLLSNLVFLASQLKTYVDVDTGANRDKAVATTKAKAGPTRHRCLGPCSHLAGLHRACDFSSPVGRAINCHINVEIIYIYIYSVRN